MSVSRFEVGFAVFREMRLFMRIQSIALLVGTFAFAGSAMADWYVGDNAHVYAANAASVTAGLARHTTSYGNGNGAYEFSTFGASHFSAADTGSLATVLSTPLPGAWNNSGNTTGGFTGANAAALNDHGAHWVHNSTDNLNGGDDGVSVLYSLSFTATSTVTHFELYYLTDNGLGNANGANGVGATTGFSNDGLWVNGNAPTSGQYSSPGTSNAPAEFGAVQHVSFTANTVVGTNTFYFYQFNWGGPGGSAFALEVVPVPAAVWSGASTLAGVGLIGFVRRRRMA
jgi:hypothetical protein